MNRMYSATYSNVPVYEFTVDGNQVMRRRSDSWINATHILKVADYDKPARTRILEREVQKNTHEKVQGGYGKYQGTWIPLGDGRILAERCGCLQKLLPIFDFVPGDRSPPPAPKHTTAASSRPKAPRQPAQARRMPAPQVSHQSRMSEVSFDQYSQQQNDDKASVSQVTLTSDSEGEGFGHSFGPGSRKRKRGVEQPQIMSMEDQQHLIWSDELLDYFMLQRSEEPMPQAPIPAQAIDLNRAVDEKGNTALHWAAAMGDLNLVQEFIQRGAKVDSLTVSAATPLMHAVTFTNNWDKQTMPRLIDFLYMTVGQRDCCLSTVFHHIVVSTMSKSKYPVARYYLECILERLKQAYEPANIAMLLDVPDSQGNTAALLAAKYGARKCVRLLAGYGASTNVPNHEGETAEKYIRELNERRRDRQRQGSSSPLMPPDGLMQTDPPSLSLHHSTTSMTRMQQYTSEAASLLASQLPALITARAEALAASLESELTEKEAEIRENERLLERRRHELSALREQTEPLAARDEDDAAEEAQCTELEELMVESRRLIEAEQEEELRRLIAEAESQTRPADEVSGELASKWKVARQLQQQQTQRKRLVADIVTAQGFAGVGDERQEAYKRLITSALGVRTEDVETMLPEILQELEEARSGGTGLLQSPTGAVEASAMDGVKSDHVPVQVMPVSVQS